MIEYNVIVTVPANLFTEKQIENNLREKSADSEIDDSDDAGPYSNLIVVFGPYDSSKAISLASRAIRSLDDQMAVAVVAGACHYNPIQFK